MGLPIVRFSLPHDGPRRAGHQGGFTYLAAIIAIAILGVHLAAAGTLWHAAAQRERESQLRFVGNEFRNAIRSYYEGTTGTVKIYPATLEDLLLDKRYLGVKRHLRRIYRDPLTGRADWELIRALDGGIMGIRSKAQGQTFARLIEHDSDAQTHPQRYSDWRFVYEPEDGRLVMP